MRHEEKPGGQTPKDWPTCRYQFRPDSLGTSLRYANNAICLGLATSNDCRCRHNVRR